jgi:hypothetical protein
MISLPGSRGFVEVITENNADPSRRKGQVGESRIAAFFYQPDGTTEMSPAPTDVKVKVGTGEKSPVLNLTPQTKETGKFASEPALLPDGFQGKIEARVQGEPLEATFRIR